MTATPPSDRPARRGLISRGFGLWFSIPLWGRIMAALVAGAGVGLVWGENAASIKWIGDLFVLLIRMAVIPLVFVTIVSGVAALGDPRRLGSIGVKTIVLYLFTTAIAVTVGLALGTWAQPGAGASFAGVTPQVLNTAESVGLSYTDVIPANVFKALADGALLPTIFFAGLLGSAILG
ncbi:MAG: cation:dicarboxylase symporter family transporter, partial [Caulobacter sp.]|nr:cation:dicarboxylase symporter family transporter [Caulobacter sp.]